MRELDVFIQGETMDLCITTEEFARESSWYSWFNMPEVTKFLEQGIFPNTQRDQANFVLAESTRRLILIISNKKNYLGVISLSNIDLVKKKCDVAIVVNSAIDRRMAPYISLEAMARISEHGFVGLGMNRICAGQHINLAGWQQRMELLGYRIEGIHKRNFVKGREIGDSVSIACNFEDFEIISIHRGGLWDSLAQMRERIKKLPKDSFSRRLKQFLDNEGNNYYDTIFSL